MSDDEIIERLTTVRGIGRWTVEMLLLFDLGRLDVWPTTDYGVRKGFAKTFGKRKLPTPKELLRHGEKFRPLSLGRRLVFLARLGKDREESIRLRWIEQCPAHVKYDAEPHNKEHRPWSGRSTKRN